MSSTWPTCSPHASGRIDAGRRQVAVVCGGGNISPAQLTALWPRDPA